MKQIIDARVELGARRLLAHTEQPVAAIARRLGFSEPTDFGEFFTRCTSATPGGFRQAHGAPAWPDRRRRAVRGLREWASAPS